MIESKVPETWIELQNEVNRIFVECRFESETPKIIETVRGKVEVDIVAVDTSLKPTTVYLCECKHWKSAIPQTVIHGFRTVVSDFGANWGFIISLNGYQSGSYEAIKNTNIKLLDWFEFQNIFEERWYKEYFQQQLSGIGEPLIEYTEPINSGLFRRVDLLNLSAQKEFKNLRGKYRDIAFFALILYVPSNSNKLIKLPLKSEQNKELRERYILPSELLEATTYREVLRIVLKYIKKGLDEFDNIFGYRV